MLLRAHETVRRDRNHASVIIWSIGNEDPLTDLHMAAIRYVKAADPTRPVLMPWNADETLPPEIDILAPHYKSARDYDRMTAAARRPLLTTEYTHALGPQDFGGLQDRWQAITSHKSGAGGMIWLWQDQGIIRQTGDRAVLDPVADLGQYRARGNELVRHAPGATGGGGGGGGRIMDSHGVFGSDGIVDPDRKPQRDYWETKAVYAPVRVMTERLLARPGQPAAIPIRNDFDFTNLSAVRVAWQLMRDDAAVASGEARLDAAPHTTAVLQVPTDGMAEATGATYSVQLGFFRADGSEITTRSVRLETGAAAPPPGPAAARVTVTRSADAVTVTAGEAVYRFDPRTAQLAGASLSGQALATGGRLSIWRPLTFSELRLFRGGDDKELPLAPELDRYRTTVRSFDVTEAEDAVRIVSEIEGRVDERNGFTARLEYRVDRAGALGVRYEVRPQVQIGWLPEIGMAFETAPGLGTLRWAGLGPIDSTPDKRAAARFGVWSAQTGLGESAGARTGVEWAELRSASGGGLRVTGAPFVRWDGAAGTGQLRVLSAMVGSSTKFNRPEALENRLDLTPGRSFVGSFTLTPQGAGP